MDFFPIEKVFRKTAKTKNFSTLGLIMSEISANLKNIFREQEPGGGVSPNPSFELEISDLRLSFQRAKNALEAAKRQQTTPHFTVFCWGGEGMSGRW